MRQTFRTALLFGMVGAVQLHADSKPLIPSQIRGLDPALYRAYETAMQSGNFTCLDSSASFPISALNDDYCDCPDGSDEPGTSACSAGTFWCRNEGHIPGRVLKSRVNDGICEPECCDGSDEYFTYACPDRCAELGKAYREQVEAEQKVRKTGAKIRGTYIKWAVGEKKRLTDELETNRGLVKGKETEVEKARVALERAETQSREALEKRKQSPLYIELLSHRLALTRLRSKTMRLQSELDTVRGIMDELAKGYNPNYQDMAVKGAVVGYEELYKKAEPGVDDTAVAEATPEATKDVEKEEEIQDSELNELARKDFEALLLADIGDAEVDETTDSILWKIDEYIPEALYDSWELVRDSAIDWLIKLLSIFGRSAKPSPTSGAESAHVTVARQNHQTLSSELGILRNDIRNAEETIEKMGSHFGADGEWKKLDGTCIDKVSGDYTYELCFFGRATQKSNKDHSQNHLGTFSDWNTTAEAGASEYYSQQRYLNGAKCWNGPMRSAIVDITCGTTNALLSISEPEKCEYRFKVTSPALCWPLLPGSTEADGVKEEL